MRLIKKIQRQRKKERKETNKQKREKKRKKTFLHVFVKLWQKWEINVIANVSLEQGWRKQNKKIQLNFYFFWKFISKFGFFWGGGRGVREKSLAYQIIFFLFWQARDFGQSEKKYNDWK